MKDYIVARVKEVAEYTIKNKSTMRATAKKFGCSKATIQIDLTERLPKVNPILYKQVIAVLEVNKREGPLRGGMVIKNKYRR